MAGIAGIGSVSIGAAVRVASAAFNAAWASGCNVIIKVGK